MKRWSVLSIVVVFLCLGCSEALAKQTTVFSSSISTRVVTYSSPALFKGRLIGRVSGRPIARAKVYLLRNGQRYATLRTDADGRVSRNVKYAGRAKWAWRYSGSRKHKASVSTARVTDPYYVGRWTSYAGYAQADFDSVSGRAYQAIVIEASTAAAECWFHDVDHTTRWAFKGKRRYTFNFSGTHDELVDFAASSGTDDRVEVRVW
jgi:hypothetical protein